jgi:hypothetical protein
VPPCTSARDTLAAVLVRCPECAKEVSDRAQACPGCGFPIAEQVAQTRAAEAAVRERASRRQAGDADCVACTARGFRMVKLEDDQGRTLDGFTWCEICEHSGRVTLCHSDAGYWAVRGSALQAFLAGDIDDHDTDAVRLGPDAPVRRYPAPP